MRAVGPLGGADRLHRRLERRATGDRGDEDYTARAAQRAR
jgi:hypothetical protein